MSEWKLKVSTQYTGEFSKMNALCNSSHCSKDPRSDITEWVLESMKIQYLKKNGRTLMGEISNTVEGCEVH